MEESAQIFHTVCTQGLNRCKSNVVTVEKLLKIWLKGMVGRGLPGGPDPARYHCFEGLGGGGCQWRE